MSEFYKIGSAEHYRAYVKACSEAGIVPLEYHEFVETLEHIGE